MSSMQHLSARKVDSTPTHGRLLALPPELRNHIYDYVFDDLHDICASFIDALDNDKWRYTASSRRLALRQTCKLIATETIGFWCENLNVSGLIRWSVFLQRDSEYYAKQIETFNAAMERRWTDHGLDATQRYLGKAFNVIDWPVHFRCISRLTIDHVWLDLFGMQEASPIECLSFFKKYSDSLDDVRIVFRGSTPWHTERYYLDGTKIRGWYHKAIIGHL